MRTPYPRTPHLPWSPGATADDVRVADLGGLRGREVVVTEKLDGENTTRYADGLHARSLDSAHHPSRSWVKGLQGRIGPRLPRGWRICGENVYARHSIGHSGLESWFYGFPVWDGDRCLDWDRAVRFLRDVGVPAPPVLWRGTADPPAVAERVAAALPGADVRPVVGARTPGLRLLADGLRVDLAVAVGDPVALSAIGDAEAVPTAVGDRVGDFARLARRVKAWARGLDSAPFGGVPGLGGAPGADGARVGRTCSPGSSRPGRRGTGATRSAW